VTTFADKLLLGILLTVTAGSFFATSHFSSEGRRVMIEVNDIPVYKGNLAEDRKVTIHGAYGDVFIEFKDGKVGVRRAECPNKICVRTGWRSLAGESIICVPNKVVIRILGEETATIRGITG
jgi:hypothetical protein